MPITVSCQGCGKAYSVPDERAGQRFKCKSCGTVVSVPADEWGFGSDESAFAGNNTGFADSGNPYAAPVSAATSGSRMSRAEALSKTNVCAIMLYVVAGLSLLNHLYSIIAALLGENLNPFAANGPPPDESMKVVIMVAGVIGGLLGVTLDVLVALGAYNLQKLTRYPLAMTGAIIACIPCCGPCFVFGIPFGIWALILLNDSRIRAHFQ
jgi:hypothetical protein